jgi:hypothetical protein
MRMTAISGATRTLQMSLEGQRGNAYDFYATDPWIVSPLLTQPDFERAMARSLLACLAQDAVGHIANDTEEAGHKESRTPRTQARGELGVVL